MFSLLRSIMPASTVALLAVDLLLIAAAFAGSIAITVQGDPRPYIFDSLGWIAIIIVMIAFVGGMYFHNLYSQVYIRSRVLLLEQLCIVAGLAFILEGLISYLSPDLRLEIGVMLWGGLMATSALFAWRLFFSRYSLEVLGLDRLLVIGDGPVIDELATYIQDQPQAGFLVAGRAGNNLVSSDFSTETFHQLVQESKPNRVIVGAHGGKAFAKELVELCFGGSPMEDAPGCFERICGRAAVMQPVRLITASDYGPTGNSLVYQTVFNLLLGLVLLIGFFPVFLIAALAARLAARGPFFTRRAYIGFQGRRFTLLGVQAVPSSFADRLIRFFHLNAYLQLLGVLKGDLALVGPNPEPVEYGTVLSSIIPYWNLRNSVKPGITGWAQIKGSPIVEDAFAKIEYDLYYSKHQSLTLDVVILAQVLKSVFFPSRELK